MLPIHINITRHIISSHLSNLRSRLYIRVAGGARSDAPILNIKNKWPSLGSIFSVERNEQL